MQLYKFNHYLNPVSYSLLLMVFGLFVAPALRANTLHHNLQINLDPTQALVTVNDRIQLPADTTHSIEFFLHKDLVVTTQDAELIIVEQPERSHLRIYRLTNLPKNRRVTLNYQGNIPSKNRQDQFGMPEFELSQDGAYLGNSSAWYPQFRAYPWMTFKLQVNAPSGWEIISQGKREALDGMFQFDMPHPQDEIYLLGGPLTRYQKMQDDIEVVIYLREADAKLAENYLQASAQYIRFYSDLIGPYPYAKFAVVENRWQTGYGMPSFTLLGSRVIRLPFILHTSLPHEIVHNWWGNGVYIDYAYGNWSEGLTAYMSDHLDSEQRGQGAAYRRKALERYANFAAQGRDFPLSQFRSRHSDASQAVGYSKSMMLFHMMRQHADDKTFNQRIRQLWQRYRFQTASYQDVIRTLYDGDKQAYDTFIAQWLNRTGAPMLSLGKVQVREIESGFRLTLEVNQDQTTAPYTLQVPVKVTLKDVDAPLRRLIHLTDRHSRIDLIFPQRPQSVTLDPDYDVFRLLHPLEQPASLGRLFGAAKQILVIPTEGSPEQQAAWQQLATAWSRRYHNIEVINDNELSQLPVETAVWLLGWQNKLLPKNRVRFDNATQQLRPTAAIVNNQQLNAADHAVVLLDPDNSRAPLGFIAAEHPEAIILLARKLPHYSTYGRLAFELPKVNNIIKQSLPVTISPLMWKLNE